MHLISSPETLGSAFFQEIQADKRNSYPMAKQQEQQIQATNHRQNQESPKKGPQQPPRKETQQSPRKETKVRII